MRCCSKDMEREGCMYLLEFSVKLYREIDEGLGLKLMKVRVMTSV